MKGSLFGDQIQGYEDAIVYQGEYKIADSPIKSLVGQWKNRGTNLDYQMNFGRQTVIQPINPTAGPILPQYQNILSLPRAGDPDDKYGIAFCIHCHNPIIQCPPLN